MRFLSKMLAAFTLAIAMVGAQAQVLGNTNTYSGLFWDFFPSSGSPFANCTLMNLDATGDVTNSDNFAMYGQLLCSTGSYAADGTGYFVGSSFNMTVSIGPLHKLVCVNLPESTLSGTCSVYTNDGVTAGTAFIQF